MKSIKVKSTTRVVTPSEYVNLPMSLKRRCVICPDPDCQVYFRKQGKLLEARFAKVDETDVLNTFLCLPFGKGLNFLFNANKVDGVSVKTLIHAPSESYEKSYFLIDDFKILFIVDQIERL